MKIEVDTQLHLLVKDALLAICTSYYNDRLVKQIEGHLSVVFDTGEKADIVIREIIIIDGKVASEMPAVDLNSEFVNPYAITDVKSTERKLISPKSNDSRFLDDVLTNVPSLDILDECTNAASQKIASLLQYRKITNNNEEREVKTKKLKPFADRAKKLTLVTKKMKLKSVVDKTKKLKSIENEITIEGENDLIERSGAEIRKIIDNKSKRRVRPLKKLKMDEDKTENQFKVDFDERKFTEGLQREADLKQLQGHNNILYNCSSHGKPFHTEVHLKYHRISHHGRPRRLAEMKSRKARCDLCKMSFTAKKWLTIHRNLFHRESGKSRFVIRKISKSRVRRVVRNDTNMRQDPERSESNEDESSQKDFSDVKDCRQKKTRSSNVNLKRISDISFVGEFEVSCPYCGKSFCSLNGIRHHLKQFHSEQNCKLSKLGVYDKINISEEELNADHISNMHGSDQKEAVYFCPECQNRYPIKDLLVDHLNSSHGYCLETVDARLRKLTGGTDAVGRIYKCNLCKKTYKYKNYKKLAQHLLKFHDGKRNISKPALKTNSVVERATAVFPPAECPTCCKKFSRKKYLGYHNAKYHRRQQCDYCQLDFAGYVGLNEHAKVCHPGIDLLKKFICEYCSKGFRSRQKLTEHVQSNHLGMVFSCDICNKVLRAAGSLKRHQQLHDPESFKTCEFCGKQFSRLNGFIGHLRRYHPNSVPEKYRITSVKCDECGKPFGNKSSMRRHAEIKHDDNRCPCDVCEKVLPSRSELLRHNRTFHNGSHAHIAQRQRHP